jgi:hypothetical protein
MAQMFSLNGVAASWLGEAEKASLWREFEQEIAALRAHTSTLPHYVEDDSRPTACDNGKIDRG